MNPKLTFIVPVYNGVAWIDRCLNSIRLQSFCDFEVILVDDGSIDESVARSFAFAQNDSRFSVFPIPHGGLSKARNVGLSRARGEYIGFLDIDDWIEKDFAKLLLETAWLYGADLVSCRSVPSGDDGTSRHGEGKPWGTGELYTPSDYLALEYRDPEVNVRVGNKLYARHLFSEIRFPEGELYEDVVTNFALCRQCRTIAHLPAPMHHYFISNQSITRSPLRIDDMILPRQWTRVHTMAEGDFPQLVPLVDAMKVTSLRMLAGKYLRYGGENIAVKELVRAFRQSLPIVLRSGEIPMDKKLRSLAAMVSLPLYGRVTNLLTRRGS